MLISKEKLLKAIDSEKFLCNTGYPKMNFRLKDCIDLIKRFPAEDAANSEMVEQLRNRVAVVRCKDCKHRDGYECDKLSHSGTKVGVADNWFCADGERK